MCWSRQLVAWAVTVGLVGCNFAATETATATRHVLAIRAANSEIDWRAVEGFSVARDRRDRWRVEELHLENFGRIMKEKDFQAALEDSEDLLFQRLEAETVDALLIQSKGVGIASYLVWKDLWKGPIILLSPIPNACEHISGGSWEVEWNSTMNLLVSMEPVAIGTGNSRDEEDFIVESIQETDVCGHIRRGVTSTFEKCPWWILRSFPGDHMWKNAPDNARHIARLIDSLFHLAKKREETLEL